MISQCLRSFKHGVVPNLLKGRVFLTKRNFLTALLAFSVGMMLLFESAEIGEGIRKGLYLCSFSVIPALFPFMALSVFICKSSAADFFDVLFKPVLRFLKIPQNCGGILLSAIIGGYPAAAKCINDLVICGGLDRKSAARLLCFCVNAGPSFLIGAVGIGVFGSIKIGFLLFAWVARLVESFQWHKTQEEGRAWVFCIPSAVWAGLAVLAAGLADTWFSSGFPLTALPVCAASAMTLAAASFPKMKRKRAKEMRD